MGARRGHRGGRGRRRPGGRRQDDDDDDELEDAAEDEIDFVLAAYRRMASPCAGVAKDLANDLDDLIVQLRRLPGDAGAIGFVSLVEEVFVIIRVRGQHVQVLLSDATAAGTGRSPATWRTTSVRTSPKRRRRAGPDRRLSILADLGLSDFDLGAILDDLDMGSDEMLMEVADKIKLNPQFRKVAEAASERLSLSSSGRWAARMGLALDQARGAAEHGDVPIGAVVWTRAAVVAAAGNDVSCAGDPTAHAEVPGVPRAAAATESWRLVGHTLVVTLEPCTMCAGALVLARVETLVFGAYDPKAGAVASLFDVVRDPRLNHRVDVRGGIFEAECSTLLTDFFR